MENMEFIRGLVEYYAPEALENKEFSQYLTEHLESYFDHSFMEELNSTISWRVGDKLRSALSDYEFMNNPSFPVYLDAQRKELHFGEYVVPAYWYHEKMSRMETEDMLLRYKRIWAKLDYGEISYPLMQDWYDLDTWRQHYSEDMICKMEKDLEAGTTDDAMALYYEYSRRGGLHSIERKYPDKIKKIISIENRVETDANRTADIKLLLWDDSECFVRVGADSSGRYCSTDTLMDHGFPMFTDNDECLIQRTVFDDESNSGE